MNRLAAETFGTFCLVFAGTGAIIVDAISGGAVSHVGVALTFGLIVLVMIDSVGDVSGAHINPAVTLAFAIAGRFPWRRVLPYAAAQTTGAILASALLALLFPDAPTMGQTLPAGPPAQSLVLELFLTLILIVAILAVATGAKERGMRAGVTVGAVVALEALFAGPISGASMNPARSLAPALVSADLTHLWIYIAAPVAAAPAAVLVHRAIAPPRGHPAAPVAS